MTTNRESFTPKQREEPCPSEILLKKGAVKGLEMVGEDAKGHKFFRQTSHSAESKGITAVHV